jgi:hypothetical protein
MLILFLLLTVKVEDRGVVDGGDPAMKIAL